MRVLSIDEIPEEFRKEISLAGLDRYALFAEEIYGTHFLLQDTTEKAIGILIGAQGSNFPYKNLKIGKPTLPHWKTINRATHMGVLVVDQNNIIYLIEGILDMSLLSMDSLNDMPDLTI